MKARKILVASMLAIGAGTLPVALLEATSLNAYAQSVAEIRGTVFDSTGEPLIGATVMEKGSSNGTATDLDGQFSLKCKPGATLVISYVGCETAEVKAEPGMKVTLKDAASSLDELVVVGFGTQKKVNLTGSVSTVDTELLNDRPTNNLAVALQGAVPGLQINVPNGALDSNPSINIRGNGTIGDGSSGSPLILIDGMEGDINSVNPQDVATISVLKDAAAASIYGSRAPFGVILITTKKGTAGKTQINYQNSFRWASPINLAHTMESVPFVAYFNDGCMNTDGWAPHFSGDHLNRILDYYYGKMDPANTIPAASNGYWEDGYAAGNANVDWYGEVFNNNHFAQEHNLSVSGGTEKINYYFSGNFSNQDGTIRLGQNDKKIYNITGRFSAQMFDWLRVTFSSRWNRQDFIRPATLTNNLYQTLGRQGWPTLPLYDPNGYYYDAPSPALGLVEGGKDTTQADRNINQLDLTFYPMKGWDIHAELNYSVLSQTRHWDSLVRYNHDVEGNPYVYSRGSNVHEDYKKENFFNVNLYTNYDWTIKEKNDFHVMLGFQTENMNQLVYGMQREGILVDNLPVVDLTSGLDYSGEPVTPSVNGAKYAWDTAGFFGRINYNYDSRYLAEVNLRYDGTSRFRSNRRWIWLPSFSLGWNIANEKFWEDYTNVCNQLKLRASWGELGNQNTNNWYQTYRVLGIGINNGGWLQNGLKPNTVGFPALVSELLGWEKVYNWNIGLDFGFFNNRLRGTAEYFVRSTKNMVGPAPELPATLGTSVPKTNNTDLQSNGWDFEISWNDQTSFGLGYGVKFVLSDARVKITRYPNNPSQSLGNYITGQYTGDIWGYETIGIAKTKDEMNAHLASLDQNYANSHNGAMPGNLLQGQNQIGTLWDAGDIMYKDLNGDGVINSGAYTLDDHGDLKKIGNNTPRWLFSLDLNADYKGFDVRVYFQGVAKRDYWQGSSYFWGIEGNFWWSQGLTQHADYFRNEDTWSVQQQYDGKALSSVNLDSYYPRPIFSGGDKNKQTQTRYLQNAAYIRLKNLQIGYSLPKNIVNKIGFQKIRFYFSGENLWTGTKLSTLFDPETIDDPNGWGGCVYPLSRTLSFGVNLSL